MEMCIRVRTSYMHIRMFVSVNAIFMCTKLTLTFFSLPLLLVIICAGEFKMGMMHGFGQYKYHTGDVYIGKFRKGSKCDKEGTFKYNNGDRYVGRFHNNVPYGRGRLWVYKNLTPKDVWNGVLAEVDSRPSQKGAFTNFNIEDDIPIEYQDSSSQEETSSGSNSDDGSSMLSRKSQMSGGGGHAFNEISAPPSGGSSVRSQRSRYSITSLCDLYGHK